MLLSKLICTQYEYTFNDGSVVTWMPMTKEAKGHDTFHVTIRFEDGFEVIDEHVGPASTHTSLHHLKNAYKDRK